MIKFVIVISEMTGILKQLQNCGKTNKHIFNATKFVTNSINYEITMFSTMIKTYIQKNIK